jgi:uncharacterized membrane protein YqaE (UPF0057 family)
MRYLLAIFLPPVAVLLCGKPVTAILNACLCLLFWIPGVIHALIVVASHKGDVRSKKQIKAMDRQSKAIAQAVAAQQQPPRR